MTKIFKTDDVRLKIAGKEIQGPVEPFILFPRGVYVTLLNGIPRRVQLDEKSSLENLKPIEDSEMNFEQKLELAAKIYFVENFGDPNHVYPHKSWQEQREELRNGVSEKFINFVVDGQERRLSELNDQITKLMSADRGTYQRGLT